MAEHSANNKRIAKNTMMLYVRMLFSMLVSLYTSRVILQTLGVEDYGIYNVVGGVVSMLGFINASMSGATMRFITYELGKGDFYSQRVVFSTAVNIHLLIAFIILIISETIGLWFLYNKMQIPNARLDVAFWVFQLSILSAILSILIVPYNATIIAHEKMSAFAYVSMLEVVLKLIIVFLIQVIASDKMFMYALFVFFVGLIMRFIYHFYCLKNFKETRYLCVWDKVVFKRMLNFGGWDLYGNLSVIARTHGVNLLLNVFFGPIVNAASGIATQVQGAVVQFSSNMIFAVKPQIIKTYAEGDYEYMRSLIVNSSQLCLLIQTLLIVPLIMELNFILKIWLGDVPPFTSMFCSLTLLFNLFSQVSLIFATGIHATGKIKRISFINGTLYLLVVPMSYFMFLVGAPSWSAFVVNVVAVFVGMLSNAYTLQLYIKGIKIYEFVRRVLLPFIFIFLLTMLIVWFSQKCLEESFFRMVITVTVSTIVVSILGWFFMLERSLRETIISKIKNHLCKKGLFQ